MIMLNVTCYGIHKFNESILSPQIEEKLTLITKSFSKISSWYIDLTIKLKHL